MNNEPVPTILKPEKGFYYHYKHDPAGSMNNYAYEFVTVGWHTEDDAQFFAIYRPLYEEARTWKAGGIADARPLAMFMENVTKVGKTFPRFQKITDPTVIAQLTAIRDKMYGA